MKKFYELIRGPIWVVFLLMSMICTVIPASAQFEKPGNVPVLWPVNGFGVDGDGYVNMWQSPGSISNNVGDWFHRPGTPYPGTGGAVFNTSGVLINPPSEEVAVITHFTDGYKNDPGGDLTIFEQSNKINDNPNTYRVKAGNVPPKDDMQHATGVFTWGNPGLTPPVYAVTGSADDLWCVFACDRWQVNGSSYVDFEFNQAKIELVGNAIVSHAKATDDDGDATGGRTPGDILITVEFTGGGAVGDVWVDQWTKDAIGSAYYWKGIGIETNPAIYCAFNLVNTYVPWPIYDQSAVTDPAEFAGQYLYLPNQFVEGAINLSWFMEQLSGENFKCGTLASIWVRSKSSHSDTAELKDLAGIGSIGIEPEPPVATCPENRTMPACTLPNALQEAFDAWKAGFTYSGGTEPMVPQFNPVPPADLPPGVECNGYTFTTTYKVTDGCDLTGECTSTFTVLADKVPPELRNLPKGGDLGCNPAELPQCSPGVVAMDDCDGSVKVTCTPGILQENGCLRSQVFTYSAADHCGNPVSADVSYTWKIDLTDPVFTGCPGKEIDLGCNPADALHTCATALALVTVRDNCDGPLTPACQAGQIVEEGCYRIQSFTLTAVDDCKNDATCVVTYKWKVDLTPPVPDMKLTDLEFECDEAVILPKPVFEDECDGIVPYACKIVDHPEANCATYLFPTGATVVCYSAVDECRNSIDICFKVVVLPCREFCTYTQGFYGSQKGTACDLSGTVRGDVFTAALLAEGNLVLGAGSNTVTFIPGTAPLIREILPGGQESKTLTGACIPSNSNRSCLVLSKQGKLSNQLLAQTLVLGLNLRINDGLGGVPLIAGKYLTTQKKLFCKENSGGVEMVCSPVYTTPVPPDQPVFICNELTVDPYWYYKLPDAVLCYMKANGYTMNVSGLFSLANKALGKAVTLPATCGDNQVTLSAIASAVDMINNAFDECRIFVGNLDKKINCTEPCGNQKTLHLDGSRNAQLSVYPNPFNHRVNFEFVAGMDARATLEIHNLLGQKIATLMDRKVKNGITYRVDYTPGNQVPGIFLYQLILDNQVITGKIVYNRDE